MSSRLTCHEKYKLNEILVRVFFIWRNSPPPSGPGSLIIELSRSHTQRHPTSGRTPLDVAEACTWYHTTLTTDIHAAGGIRTRNLTRRAAIDRPATLTGISFFTRGIFSYDVQQNHVTRAIQLFLVFTCISLCGFQRSLNSLYAGYHLCIKK